jgi:TRAP-type C4-dicarboxylate transport system permease small subunit
VVSRYVFPQPAAWTYEVAVIAFAYLVFFGAVAGVRLGTPAAIDGLVAALPSGWQAAIAWFNYLLLAAFFLALALLFAWQAWITRNVHTIALDLPRTVIYAPLAAASLGMLVQHLAVMRPWAPKTLQHADSLI